MSKAIVGSYTFEELVNLESNQTEPLIENFLYDMDHILLVGKEKANKSTLALQICCHLTAAEPLFGQFNVPRAHDVVYIQAEGKRESTKQNIINMTKVIPCDKTKARLLYYPAIQMNRMAGLKQIMDDIDAWRRPSVIVVDPLYQSMAGKIEEQESSSLMTAALRQLSDRYQAAIVLIHHSHRAKRGENGQIIEEGDDSVFGSFVWKAFADTVLLIQKVKGNPHFRKLSCDTQRMGNVVPELSLQLIEPTPFYLKLRDTDTHQPVDEVVIGAMKQDSTIDQLVALTSKSRRHVTEALWRLKESGRVVVKNEGQKPIIWGVEK